jgi:hypothetical protein
MIQFIALGQKESFMKKELYFLSMIFFALAGVGSLSAAFNFSHENSTFRIRSGCNFRVNDDINGWNGTLKKESGATIDGSNNIVFDSGIFEDNGVKSLLSATFDPIGGTDSNDKLILGSSQIIEVAPGTVLGDVEVNSDSNLTATICGQPYFNGSLTIKEGKELVIGIQSKLNKNVTFETVNTCTLKLIDDLYLSDGVIFSVAGYVNVNNKSFVWGAGTNGSALIITTSLTWLNAGDIQLTGSTKLEGQWDFSDGDGIINGNGNILDVSHESAKLKVGSNKILWITDIVLKNLRNTTFDLQSTSTIRMSNVTLHLAEIVTEDVGTYIADGPVTVYHGGFNWNFDSGSYMQVDGITLWHDEGAQVGASNKGNILFTGGSFSSISSGTIKEMSVDVEDQIERNRLDITNLDDNIAIRKCGYSYEENITLTYNYYLNNNYKMTVDTTAENLVLNGAGHFMQFDGTTAASLINSSGGNSLTLQNILLKDFVTSKVTSEVKYGDGTVIELAGNMTLDKNMDIVGTVSLDAAGFEIDLGNYDIDVQTGAVLKCHNARIKGVSSSASSGGGGNSGGLKVFLNSTLELYNCELVLNHDYQFDSGILDIYYDVKITGTNEFDITTNGEVDSVVNIKSGTKLFIDRNATLKYSSDGNDNLVLENSSSILHLNGCTFDANSAQQGLLLQKGILIIEDKVNVLGGPNEDNPLVIDVDSTNYVTINVLGGGIFNLISGYIEYKENIS